MNLIKYFSLFLFCVSFQGYLCANEYFPNWTRNLIGKEDNKDIHYGPTTINNETLNNLTIYGPASINDTKVSNKTVIKGPVEAKNSSFNDADIHGVVNLDNVKMNKLFIYGPVFARNSTLEDVSIATDKMALSNSKVKKLVIRADSKEKGPSSVYLEKGSVVDSLVFEAKNGRVIFADSSVKVNHLEGGEIQSK